MKNFTTFAVAIIVIFVFLSNNAYSQVDENKIKDNLPYQLGASNAGTKFFLTFHPCWESSGDDNVIRIYVSSTVATEVTLEIPAHGYVETKTTIPNGIIAFHLSPNIAQPYTKSDRLRPRPTDVYKGNAIIVTANDPVVCYGVTRYQYISDGYLALPVTGLGTEYVVASAEAPSNDSGFVQWLTSYSSIVGVFDNTTVNFRLGGHERTWVPIESYDYDDGLRPGETMTRILNSGDVWLIPAMGASGDLTGSYVSADKPVAVISGSFCAYVPVHVGACDFLIDQQFPISNWGDTYHVTTFAKREKNSYVSIFAKEDSTKIYRDGIAWVNIPKGKGGTLGQGYIQRRISNTNDPVKAYTLSSENGKPIAVTQYNTGMQDDDVPSDPFQMSLLPTSQYLNEITFNTPGTNDEYSFEFHYVNIVYLATEQGTIPDDIEFATVVNGNFSWQKLNEINSEPGYPLWTDRDDIRQYYVKQFELPNDGVYKILALDNFAAYAYGGSKWDSYGFATSATTDNPHLKDTQAPIVQFEQDENGNIGFSKVATIRDTADVNAGELISGLAEVFISSEHSNNYKLTVSEFIPGQDSETSFKLEVIDSRLDAEAVLVVTDRKGNVGVQSFAYTAPFKVFFALVPSNYDFGTIEQDSEAVSKEFTVTNLTQSDEKYALGKIFMESSFSEVSPADFDLAFADINSPFKFDFSNFDFETPFARGESRTFTVTFNPTEIGEYSDKIGIGDYDETYYGYMSSLSAKVDEGTSVEELTIAENEIIRILPNPVSSNNAQIEFNITNFGRAELNLYNSRGELIVNLLTENLSAGVYVHNLEPKNLQAGTYFVELISAGQRTVSKLIIVK